MNIHGLVRRRCLVILTAGLLLLAWSVGSSADLVTRDLVQTVQSLDRQIVFEPSANDIHTGGIPFELISASVGSCPGSVSVNTNLQTVTWSSSQAVTSQCEMTYSVRDEKNVTRSGSIFLIPRVVTVPPVPGTLETLEQRKAGFLTQYLAAAKVQFPYSGWTRTPQAPGSTPTAPPRSCSNSIGIGEPVNSVARNRSQIEHWSLVLALLAMDDLGLITQADLPFAEFDAVETARRIIRYQHCVHPEVHDSDILELGAILIPMRIYYLYKDTLFPPGSQAAIENDDILQLLKTRMERGGALPICTFDGNPEFPKGCKGWLGQADDCVTGTENHCAVFNSYRLLSAELAGWAPNDPKVVLRNEEVKRFLQHVVEYGLQEWGSGYTGWTTHSLLMLAEFSEDPEVRRYAQMAMDYTWAIQATQSGPNGGFASGAVRIGVPELLDLPIFQTLSAQALFSNADSVPERVASSGIEFVVSNHVPLASVQGLFDLARTTRGPSRTGQKGYIRSRTKTYMHQNYRGPTYMLAANTRKVKNSYGGWPAVVAYVKAAANSASHGVAIGFALDIPEGPWKTLRQGETSRLSMRAFNHKNVVIYTEGGDPCETGAVAQREPCTPHYVPPSFYLTPDFAVTEQAPWAFATNESGIPASEATYIGWRCAKGNAQKDTQTKPSTAMGTLLRSTHVPTQNNWQHGETCAIEVGSAEEFGSFANFKSEVAGRSQFTGTRYRVRNAAGGPGDLIEYLGSGPYTYKVNGVVVPTEEEHDIHPWPRVEAPGMSITGDALSGKEFHINAGGYSTTLHLATGVVEGGDRVAAGWEFGAGLTPPDPPGDTTPPIVNIRGPRVRQLVSGFTEVEGWTLDENGVDSLRFSIDGVELAPRFEELETNYGFFCGQNPEVPDPRCPNIGYSAWLDTNGFANGEHTLRVTAVDPSGNEGFTQISFRITNGKNVPLLPIVRDSFRPLSGDSQCNRNGGDLNGKCIEAGDRAATWRSGNCRFWGHRVGNTTGASAGNPGTCWAFVPMTMNQVTDGTNTYNDPRNTMVGLTRLIARVEVDMEASAAKEGEAEWVAVGFNADEDGVDSIFLQVTRAGYASVILSQPFGGGSTTVWEGPVPAIADFDGDRINTYELDLDLAAWRIRARVNGELLFPFTVPPFGRTVINEAGFFVDPRDQLAGDAGGFLVHSFEVLGDPVAEGPVVRTGVSDRKYTLLKPASRSMSEGVARVLGGYLTTVNGIGEQNWIFSEWRHFSSPELNMMPCGTTVIGDSIPPCVTCDFGTAGIDGVWVGLSRPDGAAWTSTNGEWDFRDSNFRYWASGEPQATSQCIPGVTQQNDRVIIPFVIPGNSGQWLSREDAATVATSGVVEVEEDP